MFQSAFLFKEILSKSIYQYSVCCLIFAFNTYTRLCRSRFLIQIVLCSVFIFCQAKSDMFYIVCTYVCRYLCTYYILWTRHGHLHAQHTSRWKRSSACKCHNGSVEFLQTTENHKILATIHPAVRGSVVELLYFLRTLFDKKI